CRNVLLYFSPERRQAVLRLLGRHSHARSVLLLGAGETVIGQGDDFTAHPEFRGAYARQAALPEGTIGRTRLAG
ncbi:MAG: CheR family methyltransferase, partial [Alphaproteobacteria bacterium]